MNIKKMLAYPDSASKSQKAVALSIAGVSNTLLSIVLQMIVARLYSKSEVAIYNQGILVYNTVQPILQMGVISGIYYYFVRNKNRIRAVMTEGVLITFVMGVFFSLFLLFGGNIVLSKALGNFELKYLLYLLIPYVLICIPETVAQIGFVYTNRIRFSSWYSIFKSLVCAIVLIAFALFQRRGSLLFAVRVIIQCLLGGITFYLVYRFVLPKDNSCIESKSIRSLAKVSIPLGIASMIGRLYTSLDGWIVSGLSGSVTYSIFHMGAVELPFVGIITSAVSTVMIVEITTAIGEKKYKTAIGLFREIANRTSQLLMPIMIFFLFAAKNFICFMYTTSYIEAVPFFIVYLLYIPVHTVMYGPMMVALGKSKVILIRDSIAFVINAVLSVVLVLKIGAIGASLATIVVTYVYSVPLDLVLIAKWCGVKWHQVLPYGNMARYILYAAPGGIACYFFDLIFLKNMPYLCRLAGMFIAYVLITMLIYRIRFSLSFMEMLKNIAKMRNQGD